MLRGGGGLRAGGIGCSDYSAELQPRNWWAAVRAHRRVRLVESGRTGVRRVWAHWVRVHQASRAERKALGRRIGTGADAFGAIAIAWAKAWAHRCGWGRIGCGCVVYNGGHWQADLLAGGGYEYGAV